jgi:hypothetical protein
VRGKGGALQDFCCLGRIFTCGFTMLDISSHLCGKACMGSLLLVWPCAPARSGFLITWCVSKFRVTTNFMLGMHHPVISFIHPGTGVRQTCALAGEERKRDGVWAGFVLFRLYGLGRYHICRVHRILCDPWIYLVAFGVPRCTVSAKPGCRSP